MCVVSIEVPDADHRWRCSRCGNLTRFDVFRSERSREFWHIALSGDPVVEETEVLTGGVDRVTCRWCAAGSDEGAIEIVPRPATDV